MLLVGTRKGAFIYRSDAARKKWRVEGPHFLGNIVNHLVLDPRDGRTLLLAAKTGHLGPTVFRSLDGGRNWTEAKKPPAFRKAKDGEEGSSVQSVFWLSPASASEPDAWYAGTAPAGMFRSRDGGATWEEVAGFNDGLFPKIKDKVGEVPDGSLLHSILVDPRDARHLYIGISTGGSFESNDRGETWHALNKNVEASFLPEKNPEYGHDPHLMALHPLKPDRIYQQNHCGIYRLDRPAVEWQRIGLNMPKEVGDIGFPVVLHPRDPDCIWVFPMDGTEVWPRTSRMASRRTSAMAANHGTGRTADFPPNRLGGRSNAGLCADDVDLSDSALAPPAHLVDTDAGELVADRCPLAHIYSVTAPERMRGIAGPAFLLHRRPAGAGWRRRNGRAIAGLSRVPLRWNAPPYRRRTGSHPPAYPFLRERGRRHPPGPSPADRRRSDHRCRVERRMNQDVNHQAPRHKE
jgi:hypothetical protein